MSGQMEWRPIPSCAGYEASNFGEIRSIKRPRYPHVLTLHSDIDGYLFFANIVGKTQHRKKVHSAVAEAFFGPRPAGMYTCHSDGDKLNNRVENLRYDTPSGNNYDIVRHGRHAMANKTHCKRGHEFTPENTSRNRAGHRQCRPCGRADRRRYKARKRAESLATTYPAVAR